MKKKITQSLNQVLYLVLIFFVLKTNAQTASFTVNSINQCFVSNSYVFTNTSTAGALSYHWDFGDGTTSSLANPTHVFTSPGYHYVNLNATYSNGITYTATGISTYAGATPVPSFSSSQVSGLTYGFSNTSSISTGYVASYVWDFGDGSTASGNYVTHAFASAGTYNVKLVVANEIGCTDSITTAVVVSTSGSGGGGGGGSSTLTPSFTINSSSQCVTGNSFVFTNTSTNAPLGTIYNWNFGDGNTSNAASPTHSYSSAGYYSISMSATYGGTTYSTGSQSIYVGAVPVANFSSSFVSSLNYGFNSASTVATGYIASYSWDFGDGGNATTNYAQHTYASAGTYNVSLAVTSETGCTNTYTSAVVISTTSGGGSGGGSGSVPSPSFSISSTQQCVSGNSFVFTNTTSPAPLGITYSWNFGDGNTSTLTNPTHSYAVAGYYYVSMTASYNGVTYSSGGQSIYVGAVPTANFSSSFVSSLTYGFNSTSTVSTGYISSYSWDFGDGGTAATNYAQHTFASAGTYNVKLIVTTETGCVDSITTAVTVSTTSGGGGGSTPVTAFTVNSLQQCVSGNSFTFTNTTSPTPLGITYSWNFGDGSTSSLTNPTHSYASAGYYYVVLTATYGGQTYYSGGQSIYVGALPTASFTSTFVNPLIYGFSSTSTVGTGYINSYVWSFGDGGTATSNYIQHTYASMGTYNVKLVVTTETGCTDSVTTAVLIDTTSGSGSGGSGSGVSFNPSFTVSGSSNQCITGNSFTFNNTTSGAPVGTTYSWNFGDGSTSNATSPTHSYASAGYYYVTLTATYNGQTFTASGQTVTVVALPAVSIATYHNGGLAYTFNSTSTTGMGDYFTSYSWSFGDGGIDSIPNPHHIFATAGVYTVSLTVTTSAGCTSSTSISVTTCPTVIAAFSLSSSNNQCQTGNSYTFTNSSSNNAGVPTSGMSYVWYFGDGTTSSSVTPPAHTYASWGDYDVKLVATLTVGSCTVSDSTLIIKAVSVAPMPVASYRLILDNVPYMPTALPSDTTKRCWHYGYDFSYQSSSTLAKGTMDYFWHFGTSALYFRDGDSSHYINPRIVFDTAGTYPVKLVVVSDKGCMDSVTRIVELSDPHARFNYAIDSTTDIYASPTVSVSDFSYDYGGYLVAWNWNFGGGVANSSSQTPSSFSYACGGNHTIVLQVTSDVGCVDDTTVNFVIRIRPKAGFSISAPNYTPNVYAKPTYTFTNSTTINDACPSMSYSWNFGDGYTSTATNPTHSFKGSGTYTVTLIATNNNGGKKDTTTGTVNVLIRPRAAFSTSQTLTPNVYAAPTVSYNNTSSSQDTAAPAASLTYAWDFGDGATSNVRFPSTHQYASGGTYTVTLIVTNPISGLSDTVSHTVTVNVKPQAAFTIGSAVYSPDVYAQPDYAFTNGSSVNDASGTLTYAWNFGDGGTSTVTNPNHTYTSGGSYTVTLIVTNSNGGLKDTTTATVIAKIKPQAGFTSNVNFGGNVYANPTVNFTNTTTSTDGAAAYSYSWNFGDGNTSASNNPNHQYANGGTYTVTLIATNTNGGLKDTITHNVTITIKPQAAFTSALDYGGDIYSNPTANFANGTSSTDGAGAYTYAWDFGDGATSVVTNPSHSYSTAGTYTVTLIATNTNGGAKDTVSHNVNVIIKPKAIISVHSDTVSVAVPMPIGNADYKRYTVTALSNAANPSTIVLGSIAHTEITIDTVYIPRNDSSQYAVVNDADAVFGIQLDTLANYRFNVRLIVTSDLGIKDTAYATLGTTETGVSYYRTRNPNSPLGITTLPNIGAKEIVIPATNSDKLFVYPNPAQNILRIDARNCTNISVYNVSGVKVLQRKVSIDNEILQVQQLPSGTYIIIGTMKDGTKKNQKFIKE